MARGDSSAASLAPGFRFHPTDEELVRYYLKRKITNKPFRFDAISVIDIYKSEPWDLPGKSKLKSRDLEWYFFSMLDRKYGNGSKTNRATEKGYWKTTGKDRPIKCSSRIIGMKKTLVYHCGRAPRGERTNWVMHEYRLVDEQLGKDGIAQDAFVVCRVFQKSGTGPKNGEQYGAPFVEEEWEDEDEEVAMLTGGEMVAVAEEVAIGDDAFVEAIDFDQKLDTGIPCESNALAMNYYHGESSNSAENIPEEDQKPVIGGGGIQYGTDHPDGQNWSHLPGQYEMDAPAIKDEYPSSGGNAVDANYLLDEPYYNAADNAPFSEGLFLEANDLSGPVEPYSAGDSSGLDIVDEYLNFFDANDDELTFDLSEILGSENAVTDQEAPTEKDTNKGNEEVSKRNQKLLESHSATDASSSSQKPDAMKFESDFKYPFIKQASHLLGSIPAAPAFASEFPTKEAAMRLNAAQASGSIHVTAGMIRIENISSASNGIDWSFGKNGNVNIILSFRLPEGNVSPASLEPMSNLILGKEGSAVSRGWLFLMFFWVLILSVSYKIGTCICAN